MELDSSIPNVAVVIGEHNLSETILAEADYIREFAGGLLVIPIPTPDVCRENLVAV